MEAVKAARRKTRKDHVCDLCNFTIKKGETYEYTFMVDGGDNWEFKCHLDCHLIMVELYDWFDPDEGLTDTHFDEHLPIYCDEYVCPHCPHHYLDEYEDSVCREDKNAGTECVDRISERLRHYKLKPVKSEKGWQKKWVEEEREDHLDGAKDA